ncbi:MAG: NADH:ubiquinone reductase (Na(+)-transporting) subunit C [Bacteroidaceae bacterium]
MNTNSNSYTIIYASVVVIIVAFLLAFVSKVLQPQSDANVAIDKKNQILSALNIRNVEKTDVENRYAKYVVADQIIDINGRVVKDGKSKDKDAFHVSTKEITDECLPLYLCEINGETKYVIPVTGKGLWGGLWGYIALNADKATVYGTYFSHESETAGLGARITEYEGFQKQFEGKKIMNPSEEITLSVLKRGKEVQGVTAENKCDGITGATLTCDGVNNMLHDCLSKYKTFLTTNN